MNPQTGDERGMKHTLRSRDRASTFTRARRLEDRIVRSVVRRQLVRTYGTSG